MQIDEKSGWVGIGFYILIKDIYFDWSLLSSRKFIRFYVCHNINAYISIFLVWSGSNFKRKNQHVCFVTSFYCFLLQKISDQPNDRNSHNNFFFGVPSSQMIFFVQFKFHQKTENKRWRYYCDGNFPTAN